MTHDCFFQSIFNFASRWEVILFHNSNDNADNDLDIEKDVFSSCHERGTKRVPMRNRLSDLRILRSDALPLSYRDSKVRKGW